MGSMCCCSSGANLRGIAAAIERLAADAALRTKLSNEGRSYALTHRSWEVQLRRIQQALEPASRAVSNGSTKASNSSARRLNVWDASTSARPASARAALVRCR